MLVIYIEADGYVQLQSILREQITYRYDFWNLQIESGSGCCCSIVMPNSITVAALIVSITT